MGRFGNSWQTVKASWGVLMKDKELLVFPLLSGLASVAIILTFVIPGIVLGVFAQVTGGEEAADATFFLLYLLMYFILAFITIYFNAALISAANERLAGGDPTIRSGLRGANQRFGKILAWSLFAATVSLLIHVLENAMRGRNNFVGQFVAGLVGVAWTLATFFAIPVVLFENERTFGSLRRSGQLFKKTWGETLIGHFGIGFVSGVVSFLVLLVTIVPGAYLLSTYAADTSLTAYLYGGIAFIVVGVLALLTLGLIFQALNGIYKAALYRFATTHQVAPGFPAETIERAWLPVQR